MDGNFAERQDFDMDRWHVFILLVSFSVAMTGVILGNTFVTMMIGEINRKRPATDQMSYFGYSPGKVYRIFREYSYFHPGGRFHIYAIASFALMTLGVIGGLIGLGFFG